ncbi:dna polymerase superfamily protein [Cystoisospora suis]|uniref:DNA-directed DNA polymerase n=1 Tax=Cystoisospora suis TaxID=483139 RepID=A0A2C6LEZ5_9APIC|nr:dna polymerase superfamily protein [Cystoisospora suis]
MSAGKQTALSALEKIRRQRRGEAKATEQYEVKDENAEIYQTVTEEDYQRIKQSRRAQSWIEGEGSLPICYSDDGEEWWDPNSEDDEEDDGSLRREKRGRDTLEQSSKKKKQRNSQSQTATSGGALGASAEAQGMRSLVQHFSAIAAESTAKQQQTLVTQRYLESVQSVDQLFGGEDEDEEDPTQLISAGSPCSSAAGAPSSGLSEGKGRTEASRDSRPAEDELAFVPSGKINDPGVRHSRGRPGAGASGEKCFSASSEPGGFSAGLTGSFNRNSSRASSFLAQFGLGGGGLRSGGGAPVTSGGYLSTDCQRVPGGLGNRSRLGAESPRSSEEAWPDVKKDEGREMAPPAATCSPSGSSGIPSSSVSTRPLRAGGDPGKPDGEACADEKADDGAGHLSDCNEEEEDMEEKEEDGEEGTLFKATGEYEATGGAVPKKCLTLYMKGEDEEDRKCKEEGQGENVFPVVGGGDRGAKQLPVCEDGSLPFYFLDAWEEGGTLYLFGKVWSAAAASSRSDVEKAGEQQPQKLHTYPPPQSCCVVVRDMMVPLFFRTREQVDVSESAGGVGDEDQDNEGEEDGKSGTSEERQKELVRRRIERKMEITKSFFKQDLPRLKQKYRWRKVAVKGVFRHYAFDAPDVPRGRDQTYVKVFVPGSASPLMPEDLEGETYTHVFGVGQSLIELLLIKRRIRGPMWLKIRNFTFPDSALEHLSWCSHEVYIQSHKDVCVWNNSGSSSHSSDTTKLPPNPPLTVAALAAKTVQVPCVGARVHHDATDRQLAMASFFVLKNANIEDQNAQPRLTPQDVFCGVRRVRTNGGATARVNAEGFPLQFSELCTKQGFGVFDSERTLVTSFINRLAAVDPDIFIGHNIYNADLEVLGQRCAIHSLPVWHRLSRLKRPKHVKPRITSKSRGGRGEGSEGTGGGASLWGGRMLTVGRLVCDTYMQAHELLGHRVNYDLVPLMQDLFLKGSTLSGSNAWTTKLYKDIRAMRPFPQPPELLEFFQRREPQPLLVCLQMCVQETFMTLLLCWRLNCLPLTRELTTIGGNLWARSLQNQRAERNAFLLLHEFHREKFICPDKQDPWTRSPGGAGGGYASEARRNRASVGDASYPVQEEEIWAEEDFLDGEVAGGGEMDDGGDTMEGSNRGQSGGGRKANQRGGRQKAAAYSGGLVLEPRVGLYDTFVVLLDFNSLYPSIIQEFNVCFSTVKRPVRTRRRGRMGEPLDAAGDDEEASSGRAAEDDVQGIDCSPGLLPRILRQLVQKRKAVKSALKSETNPVKRATQEIKQLALKLTANSIYGCLGFSRSRFYAKELAAFITQQGRNILAATKDKVEKVLRLEVIYGDTDSIMVNTGLHDDKGLGKNYAAALRIGEQVKAEINKNYKKLEIDLEAVFRRLLLLKKKKYACCIVMDYGKRLYKLEQKGLDIVRRDWAKLTKVVGNELLQIMFRIDRPSTSGRLPSQVKGGKENEGEESSSSSSEESCGGDPPKRESGKIEDEDAVDTVVEEVHEKLREVAKQMRGGQVPLEFFVITKALTKLPQMYARGAGGAVMHPHVQVALRMQARGMSVKPGNEIPFVICTDASTRAFLHDGEGRGTAAGGTVDDKASAGQTGEEGKDKGASSSAKSPSSSAVSSASPNNGSERDTSSSTTSYRGGRGGGGAPLGVAERAFHPKEVAGSRNVLHIDVDYYLEQQLLPPIQRLCAYVEGTSAARLAECLGLDAAKHARLEAAGGDDELNSRDAREKAGEERIMALISKSEEKYKPYKLPIQVPCVACKILIAGRDVLRFMRCPKCAWWISPSMLENFLRLTLTAIQNKFAQLCVRCTSCRERFERLPPGAFGARQSICPRCEEGELREEMHAHDLYTYLEQLQFYLSGDVTSQQKLLLQRCPPELASVIMKHQRKGGGIPSHQQQQPRTSSFLWDGTGAGGGGTSSEPKDAWFVPIAVDANLVVQVLSEGHGKPPTVRERLEMGGDCLEAACRRVREAEIPPIKRGVELRYPNSVAAYIYLEKTRHGAAWVDMQQEREKLQQMVENVMAQNAYRLIELRDVFSVMKVTTPLDLNKRRWQVLRGLNRVRSREEARSCWGDTLRKRGSSSSSLLSLFEKDEFESPGNHKFGESSSMCQSSYPGKQTSLLMPTSKRRLSEIMVKREGLTD